MKIFKNILFYLKYKKYINEIIKEYNMGKWFSRKFILSILSLASTLFASYKGMIDPQVASIIGGGIAFGYGVCNIIEKNPEVTTLIKTGNIDMNTINSTLNSVNEVLKLINNKEKK